MNLLCGKWWSLRYSPGQSNPCDCVVMLYVGEGLKENNCIGSAVFQLSVMFPTSHKQIGPFWCWLQGGWFCVCSRTLWVSPTNSPVRLGVSQLQPLKVFTARVFNALFPHAETLGSMVYLVPHFFLLVYSHVNVGLPGPPAAPSPICSSSHCLATDPLCPSCQFPPLLPVCVRVSLTLRLLDFHENDFLAVLVVLCF